MTPHSIDHARSAFDLLDDFDRLETLEAVGDRLGAAFKTFGYSSFVITGTPEPPARVEPFILVNGWPAGYAEHYARENYYPDDPVAAWSRRASDPFEWSEARYDAAAWPRASEMMTVAAEFGMQKGFCVPIKRGKGVQACVMMAGEKPDLAPRSKQAMHLISLYAHKKAMAVAGPRQTALSARVLTQREREVLLWSAQGKSSWDISMILGVSERTVNWFIANASRKLDAVNRTQAVVNAIRSGEIEI